MVLSPAKPNFPVGTVIVKEKFSKGHSGADATPELITAMLKTATGWKYFGANSKGRIASDSDGKCASCHAINKSQDYVFRSYISDQLQRR